MKYIIITMLLFFSLQSCKVNNTLTFHNDATISTDVVVDMSEMIDMEQQANEEGNNSVKNVHMPQFPKEWQSLYDYQKTIKDSIPTDKVDILKRSMIKGIFKDDKEVGFEVKCDRFTSEELLTMDKAIGTRNISPFVLSMFKWDGRELRINTEGLEKGGEDEEEAERCISQMKKMFRIELYNTLVLESKIKKIKGKHPYVQKVDAHTIKITLQENEGKKKKRRDKEIVIITSNK